MRRNYAVPFLAIVFLFARPFGYSSITPEQLHQRLLNKDTLQLLDVREWYEYTDTGHIAEPVGQLPLTPACMPWTSDTLQTDFAKLPKNIDIVVNCFSGGRSAAASAFLEQNGFTRIFNLIGGFGAWRNAGFETRKGRFGDHSGKWMHSGFTKPDTIKNDSAIVVLYPKAFAGLDSSYCETHYAYGKQPAPANAPTSDVAGLFRMTLLDKFGLPLFDGDSIVLADTVGITIIPRLKNGTTPTSLTDTGMAILAGTWKTVVFTYEAPRFHRSEKVLRAWHNVAGTIPNAVAYHPSAHEKTTSMTQARVRAVDCSGRSVKTLISRKQRASSVQIRFSF
jgi:Rhodanese-related sulfurtransferase